MNVKELIDHLKSLKGDLPVIIPAQKRIFGISEVEYAVQRIHPLLDQEVVELV